MMHWALLLPILLPCLLALEENSLSIKITGVKNIQCPLMSACNNWVAVEWQDRSQ